MEHQRLIGTPMSVIGGTTDVQLDDRFWPLIAIVNAEVRIRGTFALTAKLDKQLA